MKLTSMQKMIAAIVLIAAAAIAAVVLLIVPQFRRLSELDAERIAAEELVSQTQTRIAQLRDLAANASVTQAELLRLATEFPDNPELPSLIIELQDAANDAGITFNQFSPGQPTAPAGAEYTEIPITASVQGTWSDVLDYLRRLNTMSRAIRVSDVSMSPIAPPATTTSTRDEDTKVLLALTMRAYVMGVNGVPPAATAPPAPTTAPTATP